MLAKAEAKTCYATLIQADLVEGMEQLSEPFELIICADTLVYIGDLTEVFAAVSNHLTTNGLFAFSVERYQGKKNFQLQSTGRFAHHVDYIEQLAHQFNFDIVTKQFVELRSQAGEPVKGLVFVMGASESEMPISANHD